MSFPSTSILHKLLPESAGMARRVPAGLRINAQPVRAFADLNARQQMSVARVERINLCVVTAREPEHLAIGGDASHVGTSAVRNFPLRDQFASGEIEDRYAALAAVGDVKDLRVAADIQPVRAFTSRYEADAFEGVRFNEVNAV